LKIIEELGFEYKYPLKMAWVRKVQLFPEGIR